MATQLLIYENLAPLSAERHRAMSVQATGDFAYSAKVNSVPLMAVEFPHAAAEYPIAFVPSGESVTPLVLLGLHNQENLYLDRQAHWQARYLPAFIRRYPFVFTPAPQGDGKGDKTDGKTDGKTNGRMLVCIDEAYPGLNKEGRGQRLFDDQAKPTAYVQGVLKFLSDYQLQAQRTMAFCGKIHGMGLLDPIQATISSPSGEKLALRGLMAVSREKLRVLSGDKLAELARNDELELVYLHLHSLHNLAAMSGRLAAAKHNSDGNGRNGEPKSSGPNRAKRAKTK